MDKSNTERILFKNGKYYYPMLEIDIMYMQADGAYTNIYLIDRKISVAKSLKDVFENLDRPRT